MFFSHHLDLHPITEGYQMVVQEYVISLLAKVQDLKYQKQVIRLL